MHVSASEDDEDDTAPLGGGAAKVDAKLGADGSTDAGSVSREEQAIKLDGLSVSETKALADKAEKHQFQAEVNRMMKLIINSLYRNKEVCCVFVRVCVCVCVCIFGLIRDNEPY